METRLQPNLLSQLFPSSMVIIKVPYLFEYKSHFFAPNAHPKSGDPTYTQIQDLYMSKYMGTTNTLNASKDDHL